MATASITTRDEFVNTTDGWVGFVQIDHQGAAKGQAVGPGMSCFLNEEEQILTANAPLADDDNPFATGALELKRRAVEVKGRRPYGADARRAPTGATTIVPTPAEREEETGAAPLPEGEPAEGSNAPGEEVATPEAAKAGPAKMASKSTQRRRRSS